MANLEKPITTQEELNEVIKDRLAREKESAAKRYEGWVSPEDVEKLKEEHAKEVKALQDASAASEQTIKDKDAAIAESAKYKTDLEKTRIALAAGLKIDYADRLRGENAEEWEKDAKLLAKDFAASHSAPPLGNPEPRPSNDFETTGKIDPERAMQKFAKTLQNLGN